MHTECVEGVKEEFIRQSSDGLPRRKLPSYKAMSVFFLSFFALLGEKTPLAIRIVARTTMGSAI